MAPINNMKIVNLLNRLKLIFLLLFICNLSYSQYTNLPLGYNFNLNLEQEFEQNIQHSSFKPIILSSENIDVESIIERNFFSNNNFLNSAKSLYSLPTLVKSSTL